jgi:two-component sensor histidine kinase
VSAAIAAARRPNPPWATWLVEAAPFQRLCRAIGFDQRHGIRHVPQPIRAETLGLRLVEMLAKQVRGKAAVEARPGGGTVVTVTFPDP